VPGDHLKVQSSQLNPALSRQVPGCCNAGSHPPPEAVSIQDLTRTLPVVAPKGFAAAEQGAKEFLNRNHTQLNNMECPFRIRRSPAADDAG
jgi:hypothetical protein